MHVPDINDVRAALALLCGRAECVLIQNRDGVAESALRVAIANARKVLRAGNKGRAKR